MSQALLQSGVKTQVVVKLLLFSGAVHDGGVVAYLAWG